MRTPTPSRVIEIRYPQHGPVVSTAPERELLDVPVKNLIDREEGLALQFRYSLAPPNHAADSTSMGSVPNVGNKFQDIVLRKPDVVQQKDQLLVLQQWEGFVTDIGPDSFGGILIDLTAGEIDASEEAELPISDISQDDQMLLQAGAVFRWLIGYRISPRGTRQRFSSIFFRRVAAPTDDQMSDTRKEARILAASIRWE